MSEEWYATRNVKECLEHTCRQLHACDAGVSFMKDMLLSYPWIRHRSVSRAPACDAPLHSLLHVTPPSTLLCVFCSSPLSKYPRDTIPATVLPSYINAVNAVVPVTVMMPPEETDGDVGVGCEPSSV